MGAACGPPACLGVKPRCKTTPQSLSVGAETPRGCGYLRDQEKQGLILAAPPIRGSWKAERDSHRLLHSPRLQRI